MKKLSGGSTEKEVEQLHWPIFYTRGEVSPAEMGIVTKKVTITLLIRKKILKK